MGAVRRPWRVVGLIAVRVAEAGNFPRGSHALTCVLICLGSRTVCTCFLFSVWLANYVYVPQQDFRLLCNQTMKNGTISLHDVQRKRLRIDWESSISKHSFPFYSVVFSVIY